MVSFSVEEKEQLSSSENEKEPHPPAEHNGSLPQIHSNDVKLDHTCTKDDKQLNPSSAGTLEHNGSPSQIHHHGDKRDHVGNGTAGVTLTTSNDKNREKVSPKTKKKGLRLFGKEKQPRRDSQKPLMSSTGTTPGDRYENSIIISMVTFMFLFVAHQNL